MRISARKRLAQFLDPGVTREIGDHIVPIDLLKFRDTKKYKDRLASLHKKILKKKMH